MSASSLHRESTDSLIVSFKTGCTLKMLLFDLEEKDFLGMSSWNCTMTTLKKEKV